MSRPPSLTDVEDLEVGHFTFCERPTGCTVITASGGFIAGVDVRGGAPGTRELDLLRPENSIERIDAVVLSGGSAFGLETCSGAARYLEQQGRGFETPAGRVPIVCGAILYDLGLGDPRVRPDHEAGYQAVRNASNGPVPEGNIGAGAGATVGKLMGTERAMKAGLGSWSLTCPDGLKLGAIAVVNSIGNVIDPSTAKTLAGARKIDGSGFVDVTDELKKGYRPGSPFHGNTVLGVVATNAGLTKSQCALVARMAHDALARCISPSHLPWDGDTVFAISTGTWDSGNAVDAGTVGVLATNVLETAIVRAVMTAESWGDYPAARDFPVHQ